MILTVTLTPALDKTVMIPGFAAGKVNRIQSLRLDAGGKGINVSKTLKALGGDSVATGILGGGSGQYIRHSLEEAGVGCDFAFVDADTRTNLKIIDPENHTNTDVNEPGAPVTAATLAEVLALADKHLAEGDIVVLAGKAPPQVSNTIFADWTRHFRERGVKVYLDADGELLVEGVKALPALIKPNDEELSRLMGAPMNSLEEIIRAAKKLVADGIETVVVSMGGDGALFVRGDGVWRGHGLKVTVRSTVGAGDSMMASMCFGALKGLPFEETCRLAMAVSAATVTCSGTQAASKEDIDALLLKVVLERLA